MFCFYVDGHKVTIDKQFIPLILEHSWRAKQKENERVYILDENSTGLHRHIIKANTGEVVDHINGDTLDNRLENLRLISNRLNSQNTYLRRDNLTASIYLGVTIHRQRGKIKWRARYWHKDTGHISLGVFSTQEAAALAYDNYIISKGLCQINNKLNFPDLNKKKTPY